MNTQEDIRRLARSTANPEAAPVVIIGAGPAGLTAAYELAKHDVWSTVLEQDSVVGGISRTVEYKGYLFDIGWHRFFTKVGLVEQIWHEILGEEFLHRPRLSRIYYNSKFFRYPLEPLNALLGLGLFEAVRCALSYAGAQVLPEEPEDNLETWVTNRFGKRLFKIFFESYTEKVWGLPCRKIRAEWAAQRIKGLSLFSVIWNAFKPRSRENAIKTLIHEFQYPRRGPGQMWNRAKEMVEERGCHVLFERPVERVFWEPGQVYAVMAGGRLYQARQFISSMPIRDLIAKLDPPPPSWLLRAMDDFHYRDFITVALIIRARDLFPDNWIYIHDPSVKVGRIQNFKNWSPDMVPHPEMSCLGLEYFCFEGDGLWSMADDDLVRLAVSEVAQLGLVPAEDVIDGTVVRMPKAYPVYDETYRQGLDAVREFLKQVLNLQLVGRNGMHRYNNQDHSMLTAVLAARNILNGMAGIATRYDLWGVNVDEEYHEGGERQGSDDFRALETTQPIVPPLILEPRGVESRPDAVPEFERTSVIRRLR